MKMTAEMRTLLRSRIARHVDGVLVRQYMEAEFSVSLLSGLGNPQALQLAQEFKIDLPTREQGEDYKRFRAQGLTQSSAMHHLETALRAAGQLANVAIVGSAVPAANGGDLAGQDAEEFIEIDAMFNGEVDEPRPVSVETDAAPTAAIEADFKGVFQAFASADMTEVSRKVRLLAERANEPKTVTIVQAFDASKSTGQLATKVGMATMAKAGIAAPLVHVKSQALTELPKYDCTMVPRDAGYLWPEETAVMLASVRRGKNLFLTGPAGTGKTSFAKQLAAHLGREFVHITCDEQTDAPTLVGMTVGADKFQDGQLSYAVRKPGAIVLIDEPSIARAGALFVFQSLLDDNRTLSVAETGERIPVAPDVTFIFADNTNGTGDATGQHEGTRVLNVATIDRLNICVRFGYMSIADESNAIVNRTNCDAKLARALSTFADKLRQAVDNGELRYGVGMRPLCTIAGLIDDGAEPDFAYTLAVLNKAPPEDVERLRQLWQAHFKS